VGLVFSGCGGRSARELTPASGGSAGEVRTSGGSANGATGAVAASDGGATGGSLSTEGGGHAGATGGSLSTEGGGHAGDVGTANGGSSGHGGTGGTGGKAGTTALGGSGAGALGGSDTGGGTGTGASGEAGALPATGGDGPIASHTCIYAGTSYNLGDTYPAGDGCNTCTCTLAGTNCDSVHCYNATCDRIEQEYEQAVAKALTCTPDTPNACGYLVSTALLCGCPVYASDWTELDIIGSKWANNDCNPTDPVLCAPCPVVPAHGVCMADGQCAGTDALPGTGGAGAAGHGPSADGGAAGATN
jgi:hypothetical protein